MWETVMRAKDLTEVAPQYFKIGKKERSIFEDFLK